MLGPNIQELLKFCDYNFTIKTVVVIAKSMLQRLEVIHDTGFIHWDLKTESILIGHGKKANVFYINDFALLKRYVCPNSGYHLKHLPNRGVVGNKRYLSLNAHVGN